MHSSKQGQRLDRMLDIHQRFARVVASGGGVVEIAMTLQALLGVPVAVVDPEGRPLTVVPSDAGELLDQRSASGERRQVLAGDHHYGEVVATFPLGRVSDVEAISELTMLVEGITATARAVLDQLASADAVGHDVTVEIIEGLEKYRWMLAAQSS